MRRITLHQCPYDVILTSYALLIFFNGTLQSYFFILTQMRPASTQTTTFWPVCLVSYISRWTPLKPFKLFGNCKIRSEWRFSGSKEHIIETMIADVHQCNGSLPPPPTSKPSYGFSGTVSSQVLQRSLCSFWVIFSLITGFAEIITLILSHFQSHHRFCRDHCAHSESFSVSSQVLKRSLRSFWVIFSLITGFAEIIVLILSHFQSHHRFCRDHCAHSESFSVSSQVLQRSLRSFWVIFSLITGFAEIIEPILNHFENDSEWAQWSLQNLWWNCVTLHTAPTCPEWIEYIA